jgi:translation initiation factor IF-1
MAYNNKKNSFKKKIAVPQDEDDKIEVREGRVIEALPAALFRVEFSNQAEKLICFLGGKMKVFKIKILVGDKVFVEIDPYGGKGRIIRRV